MDKRLANRLAVASLSIGLAAPGAAHALDASLEGIEGDPADNLETYLDGLDADDYSPQRLEAEVRRLAAESLRVYGYYEPTFEVRFDDPDAPEEVTIRVDPGEPVRIERLDFDLAGGAAEDAPFRDAIDAYPQQEGEVLLHAPFDALRSQLSGLALERGYFDWRFTERRMEIRPWAHSARLSLALDSGERYRFGPVHFQGQHIETERLQALAPFHEGKPYLAADVATFNQRLGQTEWFGSVSVRPLLDAGIGQLALPPAPIGFLNELDVEGLTATAVPEPRLSATALAAVATLEAPAVPEVPIEVSVTPADRHQFEVGLGFATDVGPRLRFSWDQPWVNRYGHSLKHDLYLSGPEQQFSGVYDMPLDDPRRDSYRLQYGLLNKDNEDTETLEASVEFGRRWQFDNAWEQIVYLRTTYEDFTQADESNQVLLVYPGVRWTRTRSRNPTFPRWGDRQQISVQYSSEAWGSDAEFLRMDADSQWIRSLGDDYRFVGRIGAGSIVTDDFTNVPPSLRFFAGGDSSVRGYGYESLAPKNADGELVGGEQRLVGSVEAQRRLTGAWWLASFVDTGDAFTDWWPEELNTSAGLGVRWISPVGPIRFDVAHPFDSDDSYRIHFAIGPEF
ncbi:MULTISPECIES: autotransporter assembly complex protein TamA [unclassified Halomonas]|uniref:autotransporter assembly complex protein TamA n=1 Tax=unclassified Halomonas TaxID=2609666 RepID=UPI00069919E0|nr:MULTISPECIES: autotransporter assembly complex family protein [unclassified Halomonas]RAH36639.1 outer membrane protein assembly factor [Halomonas sp. SL1]